MSTQRGCNVLVVEDHDTTRERIATLLSTHGFDVVEATNGREALRKMLRRRFSAIVLDLILPEMDGWQFRATQMSRPELARIPTIIVTGRPLKQPARYALRADQVVQKPVDDARLLTVVQQACGMAEPRTAHVAEVAGSVPLFWSRHGEVACGTHAPDATSARWHSERWSTIPPNAAMGRVLYQCQHCAPAQTPVGHRIRVLKG